MTGAVGSEVAGGVYVGTVGGQVDFVRGAQLAQGGRSVIAFPATAGNGKISKIVSQVSGPITTAPSDTDVIVTEFGAAELRGQTLKERARRMIAIAHPDFRESLEREAHDLLHRGPKRSYRHTRFATDRGTPDTSASARSTGRVGGPHLRPQDFAPLEYAAINYRRQPILKGRHSVASAEFERSALRRCSAR